MLKNHGKTHTYTYVASNKILVNSNNVKNQ